MENKPLLLILLFLLASGLPQRYLQENAAPELEILAPSENSEFQWNGLIPYAIRVADKEDGK
jgi:hypothetical protein